MSEEPDISQTLGDLERQVFEAVRAGGVVSVADAVESLHGDGRLLAYTTVMTVLTRLWQKGFLLRRRQGKAYLYEARSKGQIAGLQGERVARDALARYGDFALTGFVRTLSAGQRRLLAELLLEANAAQAGSAGEENDVP